MLQGSNEERISPIQNDSNERQPTSLKMTNYARDNEAGSLKIPKRKVSVFYRSFDVISSTNQGGETVQIRQSSSDPQDKEMEEEISVKDCIHQRTNFVNYLPCEGNTLKSSTSEQQNESMITNKLQKSPTKMGSSSSVTSKLPRLIEDRIIDDYIMLNRSTDQTSYNVSNDTREIFKGPDKKITTILRETYAPSNNTNSVPPPLITNDTVRNEKLNFLGANTSSFMSPRSQIYANDLVKIKDPGYPRSLASSSDSGPLERVTKISVDPDMSSREDSSTGSDSDDDSIERTLHSQCDENSNGKSQLESNVSALFAPLSAVDSTKKSRFKSRAEERADFRVRHPSNQQRSLRIKRSLSEGDNNIHDQKECRCKRGERASLGEQGEEPLVFPSFTDTRLKETGLSNPAGTQPLYRENLPENELERKYTAFSIGLSTDRITLNRRLTLSLRQRDLSEHNFKREIQKMLENVQELSPLCTDRDSIERVENVRHRLNMVIRCAHRMSCSSETLGAVRQEYRISRAILIADRYLQTLRSKCENLAAEVAETKRILLKNNIVIEEPLGEMGDDLPRIRYRTGLLSNNRTMVARRRASIATISRPLSNSQEITQESPKQRNSVSGRIILRRPSLCIETLKWEGEKLTRTDSGELRDIVEQTELRRDSISLEQNNNVLGTEQPINEDIANCSAHDSIKEEVWPNETQDSVAEANVQKSVGKEFKLCLRTGESIRIPSHLFAWQSMLWYVLIFFLGFYVKHVVSSGNCIRSQK